MPSNILSEPLCMMKLLVIRPVIKTPQLDRLAGELDAEELARQCKTSAEIEIAYLPEGPASIESEYDEIIAGPAICRIVLERAGNVNGILIDCFVDPAIDAARELSLDVPILGAGGASLAYAAQLGERISIITVVDSVARMIWRRALRNGMQDHLTPLRHIAVPVLDTTDRHRLVELISAQAIESIKNDGADVILLGCTGLRSLAQDVGVKVNEILSRQVPVLDPAITALKMLESMVALGLNHSKIAFALPPKKLRTL